jgi:carbamoyl-phosphate synthase small subunit
VAKAKILLENGVYLKGLALGQIGTCGGELCFNTAMTGYQEVLTDPSYYGQIINMTYPHIGNYGIHDESEESSGISCSGFIVKQASNFSADLKSKNNLDKYLKNNNIVGIQDIDTRMITRIIRDEGSMNAIISSEGISLKEMQKRLNAIPKMTGLDLAIKVSYKKAYIYNPRIDNKRKIAIIDFGVKKNTLRILNDYDYELKVFPAKSTKEDILAYNPDGILLSNGPGDPSVCSYAVKTVKSLIGKKPIFGICLGHQILSLAIGAKTFKLKFGHRGSNHPVKNLKNSKIEITSQNHGFAVSKSNLPNDLEITHINLNDNTIAGISLKKYKAFSVQYHPESAPGPRDSLYLFDKFIQLMKKNKNAKKQKN